jgi:serine/threonine protein kinase
VYLWWTQQDLDFNIVSLILYWGPYTVRHDPETSSRKLIAVKYFFQLSNLRVHLNSFQESFIREIEILSSISHPCIVSVIGYSLPISKDNWAKIGMGFADGQTLESVLLNRLEWFDWSAQVVIIVGMAFIHSKDIIQRDLKPSNIFLDTHHRVKICDFGTSRFE